MVDARRHILPPQTTPLERAVDQATPAWDWMADAVTPASVQRDPQFTPWLALDWQVSQFAPYFDTAQALLDAALPWLRLRGSAASVRLALGWADYQDILIEDDEAWLHLDIGRIVDDTQLLPIAHLVRASLPAHVRFYRVFHGYDARPVRTDGADWLDDGLLDDDSGVWVDVTPYGEPLKVSQGLTSTGISDAPQPDGVRAACTLLRLGVAVYPGQLRLDAWRLDSTILLDALASLTRRTFTMAAAPQRHGALWSPPLRARAAACAWVAPPPRAARTATRAGRAGRAHDNQRTWTGHWDSAPWRRTFPSRTTFLKD